MVVAAVDCAYIAPVYGQSLPFDHWLNRYWDLAVATAPSAVSEHLVWPPTRQALVNWLLFEQKAPHTSLPLWVRGLFARELKHELRCMADSSSSPQWDWWRFGVVGWSGERPVTEYEKPSLWVFGEGTVHFSRALRAYVRVRASHEPRAVPSYTGIPRQKRRFGFNTAEADYAYAEYEGRWVSARFGRFKESWGPGDSRSVWLSAWGPSYEGLSVTAKYHGFRLNFFSGYLETIADSSRVRDVQRYLAGHFLSYSNGRNFVVGTGEITLYAGPYRPFSLTYMNPFMVHLEYEDNQRTNIVRRYRNWDNWFLAFCGEWYPVPRLRLWGIWLIDDIQIDREKRPDATAVKLGFSWASQRPFPGVFRLDYVRVGTWTYRHQELYINYVSRGLPIGYDEGSDLQEVTVSWSAFPFPYTLSTAWIGYKEQGELNIKDDLYRLREFPYGWPFPSGVVERSWEIGLSLRYQPRYNLWVQGGLNWRHVENQGHIPGEGQNALSGFLSLSAYFDFSIYQPE